MMVFLIQGLFGSYSRDEANKYSDIDILYDLDEKIFCRKYKGFDAFSKLQNIKDDLSNHFNIKVDITDKTTLNKIDKKYILKDLIDV